MKNRVYILALVFAAFFFGGCEKLDFPDEKKTETEQKGDDGKKDDGKKDDGKVDDGKENDGGNGNNGNSLLTIVVIPKSTAIMPTTSIKMAKPLPTLIPAIFLASLLM